MVGEFSGDEIESVKNHQRKHKQKVWNYTCPRLLLMSWKCQNLSIENERIWIAIEIEGEYTESIETAIMSYKAPKRSL